MDDERLLKIEAAMNQRKGMYRTVSEKETYKTKWVQDTFEVMFKEVFELTAEVRRQRTEIGQLNLQLALEEQKNES